MAFDEEDSLDEEFLRAKKTDRLTKEDILDEDFKKARIIRGKNLMGPKKKKKKPFLLSGIFLIIVALICIGIIIKAPWAYIKADQYENSGEADAFIFKDYDKYDLGDDNESQTIINIFEPKNCSDDCNYLGLTFDDFYTPPKITFYGFILLVILGIIFLLYQLIDRKRNFSFESFIITHSIFSAVTIIVCTYLLIVLLKFFGVYLLLYYNDPFILSNNIIFLSPVVLVLVFILLGIIKVMFSILKFNYNQLKQDIKEKDSKNPFFIYKGGRDGVILE